MGTPCLLADSHVTILNERKYLATSLDLDKNAIKYEGQKIGLKRLN